MQPVLRDISLVFPVLPGSERASHAATMLGCKGGEHRPRAALADLKSANDKGRE